MIIPFVSEIVVERVIDGDTVAISEPVNGVTRIRLDGIDTPEIYRAACERERNRGYEAKGYARALIEGKTVTVHHNGQIGPYRRLIARITIDGQDYSQIMLEKGYAARWTKVWQKKPKAVRWCPGRYLKVSAN